jgi:hypothetical protein
LREVENTYPVRVYRAAASISLPALQEGSYVRPVFYSYQDV